MFRSFYTEGGATHYSDFIDGKLYSYDIQSIDDELVEMPELSNRKLMDVHSRSLLAMESLKGIKYACTVKDAPSPVNLDNVEVLQTRGDGSSIWKVDHWIIPVDKDDEPFISVSEKYSLSDAIDGCVSRCRE